MKDLHCRQRRSIDQNTRKFRWLEDGPRSAKINLLTINKSFLIVGVLIATKNKNKNSCGRFRKIVHQSFSTIIINQFAYLTNDYMF